MPKKSRKLVAVDCETDPFRAGRDPRPFVWGVYDGDNFMLFKNTDDLVVHLSTNDFDVYAHNGGKFDYRYIFRSADAGQEIKIINGRLSKFRIGRSAFFDSYNIFPQALATTGGKLEIDYAKMEPENRGAHMEEIIRYLKADCEALYNMVSRFRQEYGRGMTLAGTALKTWAGMTGIKPPRSTAAYFEDFSPFYYGGRVECFRPGAYDRKIRSYDIVSAFPHAMTYPQPWGFKILRSEYAPKNWGLSMVTVSAPSLGQFPLRADDGLHFPHDGVVRHFCVSGWEAKAALDAGIPVRVIRSYQFEESITFEEYVTRFFEGKRKSPKGTVEREFFKVMLNGLYGKYASNPAEYKKYMLGAFGDECPDGWSIEDRIAPHAIFSRPLRPDEQYFYNVATSAGITGFVRARLYKTFVEKFGLRFWENTGLYYCDTDCLHGETEIPEGKNLGDWERDYEAARAIYISKKVYGLRAADGTEKIRSKGVKLDWADLEKLALGGNVTYARPAPTYSPLRGITWTTRTVRGVSAPAQR